MDSTKREPKLETIVKRLDNKQRLNLLDLLEAKIAGGKEGLRAALEKMLEKPAEPK